MGENAEEIDSTINVFYKEIVGPYWSPLRRIIEDHYDTLELPFPEIATEQFSFGLCWSLNDVLGYLRTWSASRNYMEIKGSDPVTLFTPELERVWGDPNSRRLTSWPVYLRAARST